MPFPDLRSFVIDQLERLRTSLADRYTLLREIGRGGTATVYLAEDRRHHRQVALKCLLPELVALLGPERFLREIEICAQLQHPHILPLFDSGTAAGLFYYVMPYVEGESLRDRLRRERQLSLPDVIQIAREVAEALDYAHTQGVVHRDIKPANILLSGGHALVADFGLARAISVAGGEEFTESGLAVGTAEYMSPEQGGGEANLDGRTDLYALGCVVYEMLAGEPPFTGRTKQTIVARHLQESPRSLHVVRTTLPENVEAAVRIALAKVPADRYPTCQRFIEALEAPYLAPSRMRSWQAMTLAGLGVLALVGYSLWHHWSIPRPDPNLIVVFPLRDAAGPGGPQTAGEDVATIISYVLEGSQVLRSVEGRDLLAAGRSGSVSAAEARQLSRMRRARYYLDGSILRGPDSVTVLLRLNDVSSESPVKIVVRSGPKGVYEPGLGALAVGDLLPALLEPGRRVDASGLRDRQPAAIASFLRGEREYRQMRFDSALVHYRKALEEDSALALAALKGAEAADWTDQAPEGERLVAFAVRRIGLLPARLRPFALGLRDYFAGRADPALRNFRTLLETDSTWAEAWVALGEVYYHLLPQEGPPDSLAEAAFLRARRADPEFTPPITHLFELTLGRGDLEGARRLEQEIERLAADSAGRPERLLMLRCAKSAMEIGEWQGAAGGRADVLLNAGVLLALSRGGAACGVAALEAALQGHRAPSSELWAPLFALQNLYVATGQTEAARRLLRSKAAPGLQAGTLNVMDALVSPGFDSGAAAWAGAQGKGYRLMPALNLWLLGVWESHQSHRDEVRAITAALVAKADSTKSRRDSLLARVVSAYLPLVEHDTVEALSRFRALSPTAPRDAIYWLPWESLAPERMMLARLLRARGEWDEAERVAGWLDAPGAALYLIYRRPSLELRASMAEEMGHPDRAAAYRGELAALEWKGTGPDSARIQSH